jgi:hypothetical protein
MLERLLDCEKENIADLSQTLKAEDISGLIEMLDEKDDNIRYKAFLLLQQRSMTHNDVYPYWKVLVGKLSSTNSYQRSIGLMLLAENVRWDVSDNYEDIVDLYLSFCDDEKPITVRQCVQSLSKVIKYKKQMCTKVIDKLISINIMERKETQRKILLIDIINVLIDIRKMQPEDRINTYIGDALMGEMLDKKAKNQIIKQM